MDLLSQLTCHLRVGGRLQVLCPIDDGWVEDCPTEPPGVIPFHVVVSGRCHFEMVRSRKRRALTEGDVVVVPHGEHHRLLPDLSTPVGAAPRILCGAFLTSAMGDHVLIQGMPDHFVVPTALRDDFAWVGSVLRMMQTEVALARLGSDGVVSDLASAVFTLVLRAWLDANDSVPGALGMLTHPTLARVAGLLLAQPMRDWTMEMLAYEVHVSRATLARLVQKYRTPTPQALLTGLRMHQASILLDRGGLSVGRVAEGVGYESEAAFNRAFKRAFGITPGAYKIQAAIRNQ